MKPFLHTLAVLSIAAIGALPSDSHAYTRDQISIVGSGTVFPFAALASEEFGKAGRFRTPIVEATGTGGGFKLFCNGDGLDTPDITDASRPMLPEEKETCRKNGVNTITEFAIGYDGIAIARKKQPTTLAITAKDLFMGLARQVPKDGKLVDNTAQRWKEVNPSLPNQPIKVYGTSPASGTRDTFVEIIMQDTCMELPEFQKAYPDAKERKNACGLIREDGKFIEAGEDYNATAQKLSNDSTAFAIFGYSFLEPNKAIIQSVRLNGVEPTYKTISDGSYKLSRRLFFYLKNSHLGAIPGLTGYIREILSEAAIGPDGYLVDKGLIPLSDDERAKQRKEAKSLGNKMQ
jgi:phosphate transport system substrate-binding protein